METIDSITKTVPEEEEKPVLMAGYSERIITPPMGQGIPGYYTARISDGIITDLKLRCAAFQYGEKRAVFYNVECISLRGLDISRRLREMISERCGADPEAIYISCVHSHTSFRIVDPAIMPENARIHLERVFQDFCDAAQFAFEDLHPASLRVARGEAKGVGFLRRYRMKDGTVKTNPGMGNPEIDHFEGTPDESLILVRVLREGAKELLMVNFGTHADVIGGTKYCADYPGYLCEDLNTVFHGDVETLFFNGAEGDSNHINAFLPKGSPRKGVPVAKRMARILAGEVLKIYDDAKEVSSEGIDFKTAVARVGQNPHNPEDVPIAEEMRKIYREKGDKAEELKQFPLNIPEALRILANLKRPEVFELPVTCIRLGEVAFVGIPGEPFQEIGLVIKEKSPYPQTIVTCCTNGGEGYYPTAAAFAEKGYERSVSPFAHNCAEVMENTALEALKELKDAEQER